MEGKTINIFNITELQQRKTPKKDQSFELKLYGKTIDVDEGIGEGEGEGEEVEQQEKNIDKVVTNILKAVVIDKQTERMIASNSAS
jgi:hypothetical protein